ncbi:hypothetical protein [Niallia endozanthoxylica]|uniref:Uncharacterized protein n=1 Tax=Niallia endozanthoxylica TaxID=2036016 RepID=A0A5J5GU63_9BACI|nr:hypothetical protein [Niallia endozanthoxylica]KAA9011780.1 hypothetical protein F4V44_26490 [Niallia endozanthoxylica]
MHRLNLIQITNTSDIIAFVFGLIACVFTLVGLLSIFISITSQHNIQKCRELLWELKVEENPNQILKKLGLYGDIIKEKTQFTSNVISISTFSIWVAIATIGILNLALLNKFTKSESIILGIFSALMIGALFAFSILLLKLKSITKISNLPSLEELLDVDTESYEVNSLRLASKLISMHVIIYDKKSNNDRMPCFGFAINSPFEFKNIRVTPPFAFKVTAWNEYDQYCIDELEAKPSLEIVEKHLPSMNPQNQYFIEVPIEDFTHVKAQVPGYYHSENWYILRYEYDEDMNVQNFNMIEYDTYQRRKEEPLFNGHIKLNTEMSSEVDIDGYKFTLLNRSHTQNIFLGLGLEQDIVSKLEELSRVDSKLYFNPIKTSQEDLEILGHIPIPQFYMGDSKRGNRPGVSE